jgi:ribosomal protein S27E
MAIEIVGKDTDLAKKVTCSNCSAVLKYLPIDVRRDFTTDYTGGRDYFHSIQCPGCGKSMRVS